MKAISLWQPWATAAVSINDLTGMSVKGPETRSWPTKVRGRVAIHAALKTVDILVPTEFLRGIDRTTRLPYGAIVGTVEIVDCVPVEQIRDSLAEQQRFFGDYSDGRYAWILANQIKFDKPISCKGRQGFFEVDIPNPDEIPFSEDNEPDPEESDATPD